MNDLDSEYGIALGQFPCEVGSKLINIKKMVKLAKQANKKRARILVFPEMSLTGYTIRDLTYELAEDVPGASTEKIEKIAENEDLYIIYGMPERSKKGKAIIYNTAVLIGPNGYIGKYRKMYLPTHSVFEERRYFRQGYHMPVFDTDIGKIGILICYDLFFPEVVRALRLQGAELIVCISASPSMARRSFEILTQARAIENTCFLAYVNLVGMENGLHFWGGSRLISPSGALIIKAKYDLEDLTVGNVNYKDLAAVETFVPAIRDLRPELFALLMELSENL